ncbi:hypothetical protein Mnod_2495 [Methylobacterium nodulans ORS 2060]|uniref:Uncharacterized protein n=1 Tax=Methylobacterium nodulans (strain LMG 21967 / CNCM I-2342 / ORS 2060) TaxID=460265 RepID=B8ICQ4_METNO|nr:hypothetical protein Mnod_2495 [Methylobacterium nodulans ORS 2060]
MQEVDRDTQDNTRATDDACRRAVTRNQEKESARAVSDARDLDGAGARAAERGTSELRPQEAPLSAQGEGASQGGIAHDGQCSDRRRHRRPGPRSAGRAAGANRIAGLSSAKRVAPGPERTGAGRCRTGRAAGWARLAGPAGLGGGGGAHDGSRLPATGRVKTLGWCGAGAAAERIAGLLEHGRVAVGREAADEARTALVRATARHYGVAVQKAVEPRPQLNGLGARELKIGRWAGLRNLPAHEIADRSDAERADLLRSGPDHAAAPLRKV